MTRSDETLFHDYRMARDMADALRSVHTLSDARGVVNALRLCGFTLEQIDAHVADALELELDRRDTRRVVASLIGHGQEIA